jgi:hypothetical protein
VETIMTMTQTAGLRRITAIMAVASFCGVLAFATTLTTAFAHHGFTGRYNIAQPVWIEGEVVRVYFGQPHPLVTVRTAANMSAPTQRPALGAAADSIGDRALVVRADTRGREVRIEFPPVQMFFDLDRKVAVGDRVAIIAFRNCNAPHQLRGQWIQPKTGNAIARGGRVKYQVEGCPAAAATPRGSQ